MHSIQDVEMCVRENSFVELYRALGDKKRQDQIRLGNENKRHCKFLIEDENACDKLPASAEEHAGRICPNNPYADHEKNALIELAYEEKEIVSIAYNLAYLADIRMLPADIDPVELHILKTVQLTLAEINKERMESESGGRQI